MPKTVYMLRGGHGRSKETVLDHSKDERRSEKDEVAPQMVNQSLEMYIRLRTTIFW